MKRTIARLGVLALVAMASGAHAQTLGGAAAPAGPSPWRVLGALVLCLALALVAAMLLRARLTGAAPSWRGLLPAGPAGRPSERRMTLVETVRLSHQIDVCLLRCDDVEFVVAATAQGAVVVREPVRVEVGQ